jgi:uncharacterized membrane protein YhaH (DUF805 family)
VTARERASRRRLRFCLGVVVLVFMLMEGARGANAYGPDPKQA